MFLTILFTTDVFSESKKEKAYVINVSSVCAPPKNFTETTPHKKRAEFLHTVGLVRPEVRPLWFLLGAWS